VCLGTEHGIERLTSTIRKFLPQRQAIAA